jgi:cell division protein FtsN
VARATRPARKVRRGHGSTLVGVLIGLVLGVVLAVGVAFYMNRTQLPFQDKFSKPAEKPAESRSPQEGVARGEPAPLPGKPGDKPLERPRFDFYKMLPSGEEVAPPPKSDGAAPEAPVEILYLQVGSFQKIEDADNLKAKLALMGIEAGVQAADIPDKGTLHRVRIGPFKKPEDMNRSRALLAENGIQARVVKVKDGAPN